MVALCLLLTTAAEGVKETTRGDAKTWETATPFAAARERHESVAASLPISLTPFTKEEEDSGKEKEEDTEQEV